MDNNRIPHSVLSGNKEISDWSFEASHHPAPNKTSWKTTNSLARCKTGELRVDPYLQRISTTTNTDLVVKGDKTYEKGKEDFALYCPVTWQDMNGSRTIKNVKTVNAFVCDIDGIFDGEMEKILNDALVGICHVAYSSFSHKSKIKFPERPITRDCAFRIVLAVSRPIKSHEYLRVWRFMRQYIPTDIQTKDPSRLWFYPSALESRVDTSFCSGSDGCMLDIDAILSLVPERENPMPNQPKPTRAAQSYAERRSGDSDDRYTVVRCPANYPIRGYDGSTHEFLWYIKNWDKLRKHSTGNVQCYATGSGSLGSAFISRSVDIWGVPRYRFTMCNSKKVHMDCIVTDHELEIRFGDKNRSWSYLKSPDNLINMLELLFEDKLWFCEIRQRLFMDRSPIDDPKEIQIMNLLRKKFFHGQTLSLDMVRQALLLFGDNNSCNPLRDYLEGLKGEWDGTSRLDGLLHDWLGAPNTDLAKMYGKKWAISCVARVLSPGCKVDTMLVLKAPQGHGKGTFFRTLAGTCARTGYSWYNSSKINIAEKDGRSILRTAWIHEMAELSSMAKKDANVIKNFLDEQHDTFRPVYRTHEVKEPRQCVFTGSTNDDDIGIFKDKTGSRRYWFLQLKGKEHHMAYNPTSLAKERDQIWAEAVYLFEQGHHWWLTPDEQEESSKVNASHAVQSIHEVLVENYLEEIKEETLAHGKTICFTIKEMLQDIYTDEEGKPTTQRPANYENYYPALLLRLGAKQENQGKRCRRTNKARTSINTTGWWSV